MPITDIEKPEQPGATYVVLGMHRSGTSALTRLLNHLGVSGPQTPIGPSNNNQRGYGESQRVADWNEHLLQRIGISWDNPRTPSFNLLSEEDRDEAIRECTELLADEYTSPVSALKDPRIARLAHIWLPTLKNRPSLTHFLAIFRNPLEVIGSLRDRNGFPPKKSEFLWLRYNLDLLGDYGEHIGAVCNYGRLTADWRGAIAEVSDRLGIEWPIDANRLEQEGFTPIEDTLRHHSFSSSDVNQHPSLSNWTKELYAQLLAAATGELSIAQLCRNAVRARRELDQIDQLYGPLITENADEFCRRQKVSEDEAATQRNENLVLQDTVEALRADNQALTDENASLASERDLCRKELRVVTEAMLEQVKRYDHALKEANRNSTRETQALKELQKVSESKQQSEAKARAQLLKVKENYAKLEEHYVELVKERRLLLSPLKALGVIAPERVKRGVGKLARQLRRR